MQARWMPVALPLGLLALGLCIYLADQRLRRPDISPPAAPIAPRPERSDGVPERDAEDAADVPTVREGLLASPSDLRGPAPGAPAGGREAAVLGGIVVDAAERPVAGATVWIGRPSPPGSPAEDPRRTATGSDGRFEFPDLAWIAPLVLAVDHPEHQPLELEGFQPRLPPSPALTIALRPGCAVAGILTDSDGSAVEGAKVRFEVQVESALEFGEAILLMQTGGAFGIRRLATTDAQGRFHLGGLWPVAGVVAARTAQGREVFSEEIRLDPAAPRTVSLQLAAGWSLTGYVRGIDGPIGSARVTLGGQHANSRQRLVYQELARPVWNASANDAGAFRFDGLLPGVYQLEVTASGYAIHRVEVEVAADLRVDVLLDRSGSLSGTLHGVPAGETASLWLQGDLGQKSHRREILSTGSPTQFRIPDVPAGVYVVAASCANRSQGRSSPCEVFSDRESKGVEVRLGEACGVRGTVRSATTRAPVAGAAVVLVQPKETPTEIDEPLSIPLFFIRQVADPRPPKDAVLTDELGHFELSGLRPGRHSVRVMHADHALLVSDAFVLEPRAAWHELDLDLTEGGFVAGRIQTRSGEPVPQESAVLRALPAGEPFWRARSGEDGALAFPRLAAGEYEVALEPRRNGRQALEGQDPFLIFPTQRLRLVEGARVEFVLLRDPTSELAGRIRSAGGEPVDAHVIFRSVRVERDELQGFSTTRWCRTDADGEYRLAELEAGLYLVDAMPAGGAVPARRQVELLAGVPGTLDFELPAGEIRGQVLDAAGAPLAGTTIRLQPDPLDPQAFPAVRYLDDEEAFDPELSGFSAGPLGIRALASAADGHFRLVCVPDGRYRLTFQHPGLPTHARHVVVASSQEPSTTLTVTLEAPDR